MAGASEPLPEEGRTTGLGSEHKIALDFPDSPASL